MCSYCGCRNIPMIAQLNAEHDAIVNSSYALEIAFRDQDVEAARMACKETRRPDRTPTPDASSSGCSPRWKRRVFRHECGSAEGCGGRVTLGGNGVESSCLAC